MRLLTQLLLTHTLPSFTHTPHSHPPLTHTHTHTSTHILLPHTHRAHQGPPAEARGGGNSKQKCEAPPSSSLTINKLPTEPVSILDVYVSYIVCEKHCFNFMSCVIMSRCFMSYSNSSIPQSLQVNKQYIYITALYIEVYYAAIIIDASQCCFFAFYCVIFDPQHLASITTEIEHLPLGVSACLQQRPTFRGTLQIND